MFFKRNGTKSSRTEPGHSYPVREEPLLQVVVVKTSSWIKEKVVLGEAICLALTFHILAFPLIWFIGWALPWPKSPVITTIMEINLENWPRMAVPEKIIDIRTSDMHPYKK